MLPDVIRHFPDPMCVLLRLHVSSLADFADNYYPIIAVGNSRLSPIWYA
jgi:hypothetical protein